MSDKSGEAPPKNVNESVVVLQECATLQIKKGADYQNAKSEVRQSDYYPHGINTILDMVDQKRLRIKSLLESAENGTDTDPNYESIEDSLKDLINYASFGVSWIRGKVDGQDPATGLFSNRKKRS